MHCYLDAYYARMHEPVLPHNFMLSGDTIGRIDLELGDGL